MIKGKKIYETEYKNRYTIEVYRLPFINRYNTFVYYGSAKIYEVKTNSFTDIFKRLRKDLEIHLDWF